MPGAGNLLMVDHAEINTVTTQSFYSVLALAASTDNGMSWTDLGEIIRVNQAYRTDLDGYDIGDPPLVTSPDGKFFYFFLYLLPRLAGQWNDALGEHDHEGFHRAGRDRRCSSGGLRPQTTRCVL
jgi:hypothetical protein